MEAGLDIALRDVVRYVDDDGRPVLGKVIAMLEVPGRQAKVTVDFVAGPAPTEGGIFVASLTVPINHLVLVRTDEQNRSLVMGAA